MNLASLVRRAGLSLLAVAAVLLLIALITQPAAAQGEVDQSNETCLTCHRQEGLEMVLSSGQLLPVTVNEDKLHASVHKDLQCVDCHTDIVGYPHGEIAVQEHRDLNIHYSQSCANCHEEQARQQADNVHARVMAAGVHEAAVCADCHGSHDIQYINREAHPEVPVTAANDMCQQCHLGIHERFSQSVHGQALIAGSPDVPACIDCHPAHTAEDPRSLEFRLHSPEMCGNCHADKEMMAKYGISTEVFDTYVSDFHGTTVMLFEKINPDQPTNKAVCIDCHGAHMIMSTGPESLNSLKENLVETCRECHPDATANFADSWIGHYWPNWERFPVVTAVTWFYRIVIPATIGFFVIYIILDAQRRIRNRRARKGVQA